MSNEVKTGNIRLSNDKDIQKVSELLSYSLYESNVVTNIPTSQRNELARLEYEDLMMRYSSRAKQTSFPSALLVYELNDEIIGISRGFHGYR